MPVTGKISDGLKRALLEGDKDVRAAGKRWKKEIEAELKDVKVRVDADTKPAKREIERLEREKHTATVDVRVDKASVAKVSRDLQAVTGPLARIAPAVVIAPTAVGALGQVVAAAGQLTGVLGLIPATAGAAGLAFGSLKIATLGFGDALKNVRDIDKFNESVAQLAPNMQTAARGIQTLMPQITRLQMTVGDAFGAGFADQVTKLGNTYLPIFQDIMSRMAQSAGLTLGGIAKQLQTPEMQQDIKTFGANASQAFATLLQAAQPLVKAFTDIAVVGSSFLPQLATTVADLAKRFGDFIGRARESGELAEWIRDGITAFGQLSNIVLNIWDTLGGIFRAAGSDGQNFLATIENLTDRMSRFVNSAGRHRQSPWFAIPLKLNSVSEARAKYALWAAGQWDEQHPNPVVQYTNPEDGSVAEKTLVNPFRQEVSAS